MTLIFQPSDGFSVGMEMEFQLVDPSDQDLVDGILPLLDLYGENACIKPEFVQNTVEVASPPSKDLAELEVHMRSLLVELLGRCRVLEMEVCSAGTHPFYSRLASITPYARYQAMEKAVGWLSHNQVTFATHVHLGMPDGDEAIHLMREIKLYLPVLIALSASSPFWHGQDTRFAAFRHRVLASARTYGTPPDFPDWAAFEQFLTTMGEAEILSSINDIHWDIRPRPHLGTLEIRIMDAQPTLTEALSLAAFLRALTRWLQAVRDRSERHTLLSPVAWWSLKDNCYAACRLGSEAKLIANERGDVVRLRQAVETIFLAIAPYADPCEQVYLASIAQRLDGGLPYQRQRSVFERAGSLRGVVRNLVKELRDDLF